MKTQSQTPSAEDTLPRVKPPLIQMMEDVLLHLDKQTGLVGKCLGAVELTNKAVSKLNTRQTYLLLILAANIFLNIWLAARLEKVTASGERTANRLSDVERKLSERVATAQDVSKVGDRIEKKVEQTRNEQQRIELITTASSQPNKPAPLVVRIHPPSDKRFVGSRVIDVPLSSSNVKLSPPGK